jgi:hypothetical protein
MAVTMGFMKPKVDLQMTVTMLYDGIHETKSSDVGTQDSQPDDEMDMYSEEATHFAGLNYKTYCLSKSMDLHTNYRYLQTNILSLARGEDCSVSYKKPRLDISLALTNVENINIYVSNVISCFTVVLDFPNQVFLSLSLQMELGSSSLVKL